MTKANQARLLQILEELQNDTTVTRNKHNFSYLSHGNVIQVYDDDSRICHCEERLDDLENRLEIHINNNAIHYTREQIIEIINEVIERVGWYELNEMV